MMSPPSVVVSILCWHSFPQTISCIQSLEGLKDPTLIICITDNHSPDFDEIVIRESFPEVEIFRNQENLGFAEGHALVLDYAKAQSAELLWLLNSDTLVFEDTLTTLIAAYQKHGVGLYGSLAVDSVGDPRPDAVYLLNQHGNRVTDFEEIPKGELSSGKLLAVANVIGYSMLIPLEVISEHGFFDSKYYLYYEETDYCLRLKHKGVTSYWVGNSKVFHEKQGSSKASKALLEVMDYYLYRNLFLFTLRYAPYGRTLHFLRRFAMRFISANVLNRKKVPRLTRKHLLGIWHGLIGRSGKYYAPEDFV